MATTAEGFVAKGAGLQSPAPDGASTKIGAVPRRIQPGQIETAVPHRAADLELLGTFDRSGHREAPALVRRPDGQMVQLTPLLYAVLTEIDGKTTFADIAESVGRRVGKVVTATDVATLSLTKLRPLGLLRDADGTQAEAKKANPLLALRFRMVISNPRVTNAIAATFSKLFWPPVVVAVSLAFLAVIVWLLFDRGLAAATRHALYEPQLLLLVIGLMALSAGFHEIGHAAACRYSGARPGVMGAGLYLVWPAFYTDVSDSYRLERRGRLRVDLGGIYFNAIFGIAAYGLWAATGFEALLIVIPFQAIAMLRQLIPLVRLDGYHILADLTGVPDLFAHIKPILKSMAPWRWGRGDARHLKPWVRAVVSLWVLLVIPILLLTFAVLTITLPRVAATAWDSLGRQWSALGGDLGAGRWAPAALDVLSIVALAIPVLSVAYLITRVVRRTVTGVWRSTDGHPVRRAIAIVVAASLVAGLLSVWWPRGQYEPIERAEAGTLMSLRGAAWPVEEIAAFVGSPHPDVLASYDLPGGVTAPTEVAGVSDTTGDLDLTTSAGVTATDDPFLFPLPDAPRDGDNLALAVNTVDGSSIIEFALSLIFSDGGTVDNANAAYALASCMECLTVAIAFQVVVILDSDNDIIPENVAAAINVACAACVTQAVALQLIVTLDEPLSEAEMARLEELWAELELLQRKADKLPLDELYAQLAILQAEVDQLLDEAAADDDSSDELGAADDPDAALEPSDPPVTDEPTESPTPSSSPSPSASPSPTTEPSPSPSPSSSPSATPTAEPTPSP